jgi:DNA-binding SARP family transcriptional activator
MGAVVDIRLLGNVEIHGDTGVVRPQRSGERCALAVLAFNAQLPVKVTTLVDRLWSGAGQSDKSIATVGSYLRRIRAGIKLAGGQPDWLRYERAARSCVLDIDPAWVDYHRFTAKATTADPLAWQEALALWRGPALADIGGHWADHRRHTLEGERIAVHEDLLHHQLAAGGHAQVIRTVTDLVENGTPTDRLLVLGARALAGSGRHSALRGWVEWAIQRMRQAVDMAPAAEVLDEIERLACQPPLRTGAASLAKFSPRSATEPLGQSPDSRTKAVTYDVLWQDCATLPALLTMVNTSCDGILTRLSQHDRCVVDAQRQPHSIQVNQVLRAEHDGADRWLLVYDWEVTTPDAPRIVNLHNCHLGRVVIDHEEHILVAEMIFHRPLTAGETLIMDYQVLNPTTNHNTTADSYFRLLRLPVRDYALEIQFDHDTLPLRCEQISEPLGNPRMARSRDLTLNSTNVHTVALGLNPGLFGISWHWPR